MRREIACLLVIALVGVLISPTAVARTDTLGSGMLVHLESVLYGQAQEGALLPRLERIEKDVFGEPQRESTFLVRLQKLMTLLTGTEDGIPLLMKLNVAEWALFQQVNEGPTISKRLDHMETALHGQAGSENNLVERLEQLLALMWPGGKVYVEDVTLPAGTLVHIELMGDVNSEKANEYDPVAYRVVDDVFVNHRLVIPAGSVGQGRVVSVNRSGRLGQDGLVEIDFGAVRTIDTGEASLLMAERAVEKNQSLELAAGASLAGVVLLGPIGLAAGYFVRGKPHVVPEGTDFYVEVARDYEVQALSLVPAGR